MPELPEVETVKETLKRKVTGKTIKSVTVRHNNIIAYPLVEEFKKKLIGQEIKTLSRRGKWIIFHLTDYYMLSHLRMEGKYFLKDKDDEITKHQHVIFEFTDGTSLRYQDVRKFGRMYLVKKDELEDCEPIKELGLEPWDKELTTTYLKDKYKSLKHPIKSVLLDQSIITGIGNIYADEILFLSKINPNKLPKELKDKDLSNIIENTKSVLEEAIKKGGTTIRSYTSDEGITGMFQNDLYVHQRANEKCRVCGSTIVKTRIGGRGTYYCPKCQK